MQPGTERTALQCKRRTMQEPPGNKGQRKAVPETCQQENGQDIQALAEPAIRMLTGTAFSLQRIENIIAKPV